MHFSFNLLRIYMFRALLAHLKRRYTHGISYIACLKCQSSLPRLQFHCSRGTGHFTSLNHLTNIGLKRVLMLLTCIREALSSHMGRNIG
jgi:hypothetical protein